MAEPAPPPFIQALCGPSLDGKPTSGIRLVETHISWIILTGQYAYKIKKPVDFGFLNFSTLALRQRFCHEEIRLNRRLAPLLYEGVVPITQESEQVEFNGSGQVLEYAVKIKQFDESGLADRLLEQNRLSPVQIDELAYTLAVFHKQAPQAAPSGPHGKPENILAAAEHNFEALVSLCGGELGNLQSWTRAEFQRLRSLFQARKTAGFVRECHGDLHSGNLVLIGKDLIPFDCIEFSDDLRWIDCMSEIAFLFMDIDVHGRPDLAWRLLNRSLEFSGDYPGLQILNFYCVYRALVRAKVAALGLEQACRADERSRLKTQCYRYLEYAGRAKNQAPVLLITHGFSGSGKSYYAKALAERLPAIRIASDLERKRLAAANAPMPGHSQPSGQGGIYSVSMTRHTYGLLLQHAECLLQSGFNVVLDATYLDAANRYPCLDLSQRLGVRFFILDFHASKALLSERIAARLFGGDGDSEATPAVLAMQMTRAKPLEAREIPFVLTVDASSDGGIDGILHSIGKSKVTMAQ